MVQNNETIFKSFHEIHREPKTPSTCTLLFSKSLYYIILVYHDNHDCDSWRCPLIQLLGGLEDGIGQAGF